MVSRRLKELAPRPIAPDDDHLLSHAIAVALAPDDCDEVDTIVKRDGRLEFRALLRRAIAEVLVEDLIGAREDICIAHANIVKELTAKDDSIVTRNQGVEMRLDPRGEMLKRRHDLPALPL